MWGCLDFRKMKVCNRCKQTLPKDIFVYGKCRPCNNITAKEKYHFRMSNDPVYKEIKRLQAQKDREKNPRSYERRKKEWLKYNYNMTPEDYDKLLSSQNGVCAICQKICKSGKGLAIDHNHSCCPSGKSCGKCIRGLLCSNCNRALGMFQESIDILNRAIRYLS